MRLFLTLLWWLTAFALLAGYAGRLHGIGDSFAVLRPAVASLLVGLSLVQFLLSCRRRAIAGLILSAVALVSMMPPAPGGAMAGPNYRLYQKNLLWNLPDTRVVADDILASGADFVTLQELHRGNRPILAGLSAEYPFQHFCRFAAVGGTAVLSRWPAIEGQTMCDDGHGLAAMQVETPHGPLWVVALHLHWPYPHGQADQVERLLPMLEALEGPIAVGGDFNMVPWGHSVRAVGRTTRTIPAGYAGGTFQPSYHFTGRDLAGWMPRLPIDHVLVPETSDRGSLERRDRLGSDHHGLLATFGLGGSQDGLVDQGALDARPDRTSPPVFLGGIFGFLKF